MATAQERALKLAKEVMKAMAEVRKAEERVVALGEEMKKAVKQARKEAKAAREPKTIIEYPAGRYECKSCGHSLLVTTPTQEKPVCENCNGTDFDGHEPKVTVIKPPPPKKYAAGMYYCAACEARIAVAADTNDLPACEFCGADKLKALE